LRYLLKSIEVAMSVHPIAAKGFGSDSADYDAARPDHQPPAVNKLLENLAIPVGGKVVEVGSGTGKFSTHLLNRPERWEIICVEPSAVFPDGNDNGNSRT
jgi:ubiquinone/menaquinone biosynthesis C-methylase UbiE